MYRTAKTLFVLSIVTVVMGAMTWYSKMEDEDDLFEEG